LHTAEARLPELAGRNESQMMCTVNFVVAATALTQEQMLTGSKKLQNDIVSKKNVKMSLKSTVVARAKVLGNWLQEPR